MACIYLPTIGVNEYANYHKLPLSGKPITKVLNSRPAAARLTSFAVYIGVIVQNSSQQ